MPRSRGTNSQLNDNEANVMIAIREAGDNGIYGYDIIKVVKVNTCEHVSLSAGKLYPMLHRLEKGGYLTSKWGDSEDDTYGTGGARRKYYQLDAKGEEAIEEFLKSFPEKYKRLIEASHRPADIQNFPFPVPI
jgi:DNA-binding PadR family transcriptional regulator